jgi:hypothetical protein
MAIMLPVEPHSKLFIRVTDDKRQELSDAVTALYTEGVTNSDFIDRLYAVADGMNLIVEEV